MIPSKSSRRNIDSKPAPLYEQVDARIRERLIDREWQPGTMIPSEQQLAVEFGVSQGTVRRAIDTLVSESILSRRQGMGTFVAKLTDRRALYLYFNIIADDGTSSVPESVLLSKSSRKATAVEAATLGITRAGRVHVFERVRLLKDEPVLLETIVVATEMFPGLGASGPLPNHLFMHYEAKYGISVARADEKLGAKNAGAHAAKVLNVAGGAALLEIERVAFTLDDRPVEIRTTLCNTAHHRYLARRGG